MRVSIAIPSRDHVRYFPACLESLAVQTWENLEVLIADGGSRDDSLAIARTYADRDPRFRIVSTSDNGQADAVERCFRVSTGDVFGFLNADDCYVREDALQLVVRAFEENPEVDVVSFGGYYIDPDGRICRPVRLRYHPLDNQNLMKYRTAVLQPGTFWRRHVHEAIGLRTDLHFAFDAWFFYQAYVEFRWLECPVRIAGYRWHGQNKSAGVTASRVSELARFEYFKWGEASFRGRYLMAVERTVRAADRLPQALAAAVKRGIYLLVNSLSYASVYRLPGI
jgi:glycosyltransferase involved in cell wall biosynthesis